MMKKLTAAIAAATTLGFASMTHAEEFDTAIGTIDASMTATLATDYIWRGQSQTDGKGAVQASLDFAHESGVYLGAWGSNVDSDDFGGASIELDYYVGYGGAITEEVTYDLAWANYTFPGNSSIDVYEWLASVSAYGFTVGLKDTYNNADNHYYYVGYDLALPYDIGLGLHYADSNDKTGDGFDYNDWALTLSKEALGLGWAVMYSDTDISDEDCAYGSTDSCGSNVTFAVSKSF
ncbi:MULTISPECIES: TorF family putative porin [Halopseudomonas]|nr:TorF family putative porin [Halopseudomonas pelagia]MBQ0744148.1 TorF family putative porin [Pseudomonas sp.]